LRETYGPAKLGALARLAGRASTQFDEVYGVSLEQAQEQYFEDAPFGYPPLDDCLGEPLAEDGTGSGWFEQTGIDCEVDPDVFAYGTANSTYRTLEIPSAGQYSVATDATAVMLYRCSTGPIEEPMREDDYLYDDVPPSDANMLQGEFALYEGGGILDLHFEAGKHTIGLLVLDEDGPRDVRVAVWPTIGPQLVEEGE
jgi:hypothetical protein